MEFRIMEAAEVEAMTKQGKAVCVSNGRGDGIVLWPVGVVALENACTGDNLVDLGLDDAPEGLSVWEGTYYVVDDSVDSNTEPSGDFRTPNEEEWKAIRESRNPWPEHWK